MIRTIIVDDEPNARKMLRVMLESLRHLVEVVGEAGGVAAALALIEDKKPSLVFLDIEMQDGSGFDVLKGRARVDFKVIFVTAHEEYALQAFRFAALDYLLKPLRMEDLVSAVNKAAERDLQPIRPGVEYSDARRRVGANPKSDHVVLISEIDGFSVVRYPDILYCEASKNYTIFHFLDGNKVTASRTIGEYEELLTEFGFMRIHKSYVVNLSRIKRYFKGRGGEVELAEDLVLPVSRERKQELLEYFEARFGGL